ncbi:phosphonoacetaldehyde reductase [Halorhodospira halochloris]|uniref:phosphonoacetaldehyde reductase n=1 Tax=Halorhodospira halochloris TaxID=1052 RepID=UPI001EE87799|nr:phosphonoacetaldehyde reductase [Halorhodospira halochloris]MCG5548892.1 phosphonoacetaldehyde reductase [Halorhodospira halochloris]
MNLAPWGFHNPVRVRFGRGVRSELLDLIGNDVRLLIVTTPRGRRQLTSDQELARLINRSDVGITWMDRVTSNPDLHHLQQEIDALADHPFDAVVAFGGGSALDTAKVLNVALSNGARGRTLAELLEDPDLHRAIHPQPIYAMPTTAGTGSEVTPFSTVWDHQEKRKHSLAGPAVYPHTALVDPALTDELPTEPTLFTGLDAINQAAESIWNRNATPITLELAARALELGFEHLPLLIEGAENPVPHRDGMAEASLLAGLCISHTQTAICHSMSYPLTVHFGIPHGLACAVTMVAVLERSLTFDDGRLSYLASRLYGIEATKQNLIAHFSQLLERLEIQNRANSYMPSHDISLEIAKEMSHPSRITNWLGTSNENEIQTLLTKVFAITAPETQPSKDK